MNATTLQPMTPLQVALGAYSILTAKAKREFKKAVNAMDEAQFDVTKTRAYKESMRDIEEGRVYEFENMEDFKKWCSEL